MTKILTQPQSTHMSSQRHTTCSTTFVNLLQAGTRNGVQSLAGHQLSASYTRKPFAPIRRATGNMTWNRNPYKVYGHSVRSGTYLLSCQGTHGKYAISGVKRSTLPVKFKQASPASKLIFLCTRFESYVHNMIYTLLILSPTRHRVTANYASLILIVQNLINRGSPSLHMFPPLTKALWHRFMVA
jgi:hypothetical protein